MNQMTSERRKHARVVSSTDIAILHGEDEMLARLKDISVAGLQFEVDALEMERLKDGITAVRLSGLPALGIKMIWGLGDSFGAEFTAPEERVAPIVEAYLQVAEPGEVGAVE